MAKKAGFSQKRKKTDPTDMNEPLTANGGATEQMAEGPLRTIRELRDERTALTARVEQLTKVVRAYKIQASCDDMEIARLRRLNKFLNDDMVRYIQTRVERSARRADADPRWSALQTAMLLKNVPNNGAIIAAEHPTITIDDVMPLADELDIELKLDLVDRKTS